MADSTRSERARARAIARRRARLQRTAVAAVALLLAAAGGAYWLLSGDVLARGDTPTATAHPALTVRSASAETTGALDAARTLSAYVSARASQPATISVAAVGDMIFDRRVKELVRAQGGEAPLADVASHLAAADIAVGNLESPLSEGGTQDADKDVTFRGDPRGADGLARAGFDFLSLANNHVLDYGSAALADTVALLDAKGIMHAGAGQDRTAAWRPAVKRVGNASVAFLSFSHILPAGFIATDSSAGLARGRGNMDAVEAAIRVAKAEHDYVLVSFHWGVEYADDCNGDQVTDAHRAVDAGADMVLSHHPHVIQAVEYYKGRLIAYSLGDFVFDHYSRKTGEAFILDAALGPAGVTDVRITPVYLDSYGKPEFVTGDEAEVILERLRDISAKRGATVAIDGDTAEVLP
ncbi:MAG: CapA family protein [Anaerosomatales bacterium]|nr:CapA family protein [Anaerosomatales bacterium]